MERLPINKPDCIHDVVLCGIGLDPVKELLNIWRGKAPEGGYYENKDYHGGYFLQRSSSWSAADLQ